MEFAWTVVPFGLPGCYYVFVNTGSEIGEQNGIWAGREISGGFGCFICLFVSSDSNMAWNPAEDDCYVVGEGIEGSKYVAYMGVIKGFSLDGFDC